MKTSRHASCLALALLLGVYLQSPARLHADIRLPKVLSDRMVLQQNLPLVVWGHADPGESVKVSFRGQEAATQADSTGRWRVLLAPMAPGGPFEMAVIGKNSLKLQDILVGDVWVCSGQSNMEWPMSQVNNAEQEIAAANFPRIRLFSVKHEVADTPQEDLTGEWTVTTPENIKDFSAVGYFFGRELHKDLNVPVGLIDSSWGGTPAESWTSEITLRNDLSLQPILWQWKRVLADYPGAKTNYERDLAAWEKNSSEAKAAGKPEPPRPAKPRGPGHSWTPAGLFNAMLAPLTSFGIRGAIWYQGESNAQPFRAGEYRRLFSAMIEDWRRAWDQGPFPFFFVQLANFKERKTMPTDSAWAELRESQTAALGLPNTGMAVIIDIGEAGDIHPRNKQDVGHRLALAAKAVAFGKDVSFSGPLYKGMTLEGNQVRVHFAHAGAGMKAKDGGALKGFAVAGKDRKFVWANARIEGKTIVVSSPSVNHPVAVRYGWADNPECNLYGGTDLPASPFRTDNWPGLYFSEDIE